MNLNKEIIALALNKVFGMTCNERERRLILKLKLK